LDVVSSWSAVSLRSYVATLAPRGTFQITKYRADLRGEPCVERGILSRHLGAHADAALVNVDFGAATLARDVREIACCV
jgi:hypothetical protein